MKIYAISGLGADSRVFKFLDLDNEIIPIEWIKPINSESIEAYAKRLSKKIIEDKFILIGVSFGGIMATEVAKIKEPIATILISSAETKHELRWIYRTIGKLNIIRFIPYQLLKIPPFLANWLFGTNEKALLKEILKDSDLFFTKWAINQLTRWNKTTKNKKTYKICGENDKLIPPNQPSKNVTIIQNGEHLMIIDKSKKVSEKINSILKALKPNFKSLIHTILLYLYLV